MTIERHCAAALRKSGRPKYQAIAETLAASIHAGSLAAGARLPPQRGLADALGVTLGTITRAYRELEKRGLVTGNVGRGTYVLTKAGPAPGPFPAYDAPNLIHLDANHPAADFAAAFSVHAAQALSLATPLRVWDYAARSGAPEHRVAGARWLGHSGWQVAPEELVVTAGAQQAILLALAALAQPGDVVAVEALVYPGVIAAARLLRVELRPVPLDAHGMSAEGLSALCDRHTPVAMYCVPALQNPTGSVMPASRRRALAEVARRHGLSVIEDDVYGRLLADPPAPLSSFCPERAWTLSSLSKTVAPGLRVGYLRVPPEHLNSVQNLLMAMTVSSSPVTAEVATHAIVSGWADEALATQRDAVQARRALARSALAGRLDALAVHPASPHLWIPLPPPWRAHAFEQACCARGVAVAPAELFAAGRSHPPQAVRLSLTGPPLDDLVPALQVVAELLGQGPAPAPVAV